MIKSYKELEIYNRSYKIALKLHETVKKFPETERYGLETRG